MKFYETKQFRELETEWDQKLEASGFEDVEKKIGEKRELKRSCTSIANCPDLQRAKKFVREMRIAYFEKISDCFNREIFLEHRIMRDYAAGKNRIDIHKELLDEGFDVEYETIRYIIRRYEYKWGIKNYTARQLNLKKLPIRS